MDVLTDLGTPVLILIGLLVLLQLVLMIWALIDVIKRPDALIRGPKWLWVIVIVFGELIGPLVYLIAARRSETVDVTSRSESTDRAAAAADVLYGPNPAQSAAPSVVAAPTGGAAPESANRAPAEESSGAEPKRTE